MAYGTVSLRPNGTYDMNTYLGTRIETFRVGDKLKMIAVGSGANNDYDGCIILVRAVRGTTVSARVLSGYHPGSELDWNIDNISWSAVAALDWDE